MLNHSVLGLRRYLLAAVLLGLTLSGCTGNTAPPAIARDLQPAVLNADYAIMRDGYRLPVKQWQPESRPKAIVLALHGFNDYSNAFAGVGPFLAERGIVTYAYDQRGFGATDTRGDWSGTAAMVADARAMAALLREKHPGLPLYVLGESMGGAVTMNAATGARAVEADGIILAAPAVWGRVTMGPLKRVALWIGSTFLPEKKLSGRGLDIVPSDNIEMRRALARDPLMVRGTKIDAVRGLADLMDAALASSDQLTMRTLILYGERDQIMPKQPTCAMIARLPDQRRADWRLSLYPNGYHMLTRDLQAEVVLDDIASWILNGSAPLPSGLETDRNGRMADFCDGRNSVRPA